MTRLHLLSPLLQRVDFFVLTGMAITHRVVWVLTLWSSAHHLHFGNVYPFHWRNFPLVGPAVEANKLLYVPAISSIWGMHSPVTFTRAIRRENVLLLGFFLRRWQFVDSFVRPSSKLLLNTVLHTLLGLNCHVIHPACTQVNLWVWKARARRIPLTILSLLLPFATKRAIELVWSATFFLQSSPSFNWAFVIVNAWRVVGIRLDHPHWQVLRISSESWVHFWCLRARMNLVPADPVILHRVFHRVLKNRFREHFAHWPRVCVRTYRVLIIAGLVIRDLRSRSKQRHRIVFEDVVVRVFLHLLLEFPLMIVLSLEVNLVSIVTNMD